MQSRKSRSKYYLGVLFLGLMLLLPGAVLATEKADRIQLILDNGDRISGELESLADGKLKVKTTWGGILKVAFSSVVSLDSKNLAKIELADGRTLEGPLILHAGEGRVGNTAFAQSEITAINPPVIPPVTWHFSLSLGVNLKSGNTEQTAAYLAAAMRRETAHGRFKGEARLNRTEEDRQTTAKDSFLGLQYDFLYSEKSFAYIKGDFLEDEFRDLDLRSVLGVGLGYQVRDTEKFKLQAQGGLAYLVESFRDQEDQDELTVEAGYDLTWKIGDWGTFSELLRLRPSFEDDAYQLRFENSLSTAIAQSWALKLSALLDYDSEPPPGVEEEDLLFIIALQYALDR